MNPKHAKVKNDYSIASVARALQLLKMFTGKQKEMSLTEISIHSKITKSSCLRILQTLENEGFVRYVPSTRMYKLGTEIYNLSCNGYDFMNYHALSEMYLKPLAVEFGVISQIGVLQGDDVIIITREYPDTVIERFSIVATMGQAIPLHCTGLGKILMAFSDERTRDRCLAKCKFEKFQDSTITNKQDFLKVLDRIREQGYCIIDREHEANIVCIAFPIYDYRGKAIAAFSISGASYNMNLETIDIIRKKMFEISIELSKEFGHS